MNTADDMQTLTREEFPPLLQEINDPPKQLFVRGKLPSDEHLRFLAVVGSRKYTQYGRDACERLIRGLSGYPVCVVSGLALGIDGIAHKAALTARLPTIAIPGSGLGWDVLYPRAHHGLAREILASGGALASEFEQDFKPTTWSFPQRNRIMAGMAHATLIIEAAEKSGTLITARLAMEYNRDVLVVPGPITHTTSVGSNKLLRDGATAVTSSEDILEALRLATQHKEIKTENLSADEQKVIELLHEPTPRDEIVRALGIPAHKANVLLSAMELKGLIHERLGRVMLK